MNLLHVLFHFTVSLEAQAADFADEFFQLWHWPLFTVVNIINVSRHVVLVEESFAADLTLEGHFFSSICRSFCLWDSPQSFSRPYVTSYGVSLSSCWMFWIHKFRNWLFVPWHAFVSRATAANTLDQMPFHISDKWNLFVPSGSRPKIQNSWIDDSKSL